MNSVHEEIRDDLAAYALGALEGADLERLEEHLAECESCRGYLQWLEPAVEVLPASVEQLAPPRSLERSLMATVRAEAKRESETRREQRRGFSWPSWRGLALRPATVLAAIGVLAAGLAVGYAIRGSDDADQTVIAAQPTPAAPGPINATLERDGDSGTLRVEQMPQLQPNEVYEAWIGRGEGEDLTVQPAGTFVLESDGSGSAVVDGSLEGADSVLVSVEPEGGSEQPTSDPVLEVPLS
jgi:anti-sigma-K factor RskA